MANQTKKPPLTAAQKRAKGYVFAGKVGEVDVFIPLTVSKALEGLDVDVFEAQIERKKVEYLKKETDRQEGSAEANLPMVFERSTDGRKVICKQTGTRQWLILTKAKASELIASQKKFMNIVATLEDTPLTALEQEE